MRRRFCYLLGTAGAALTLLTATPARAHDDYYLGDGCRPVRIYEPARVTIIRPSWVRVYEPVRIYGPYYPLECDPYVDRGYYGYGRGYYPRRERGFSLDINIHFGSRRRYDTRYDRFESGLRRRYRRFRD